jgi:hypothetical protein
MTSVPATIDSILHLFTEFMAVAASCNKAQRGIAEAIVKSKVFSTIADFQAHRKVIREALVAGLSSEEQDLLSSPTGTQQRSRILARIRVQLHRVQHYLQQALPAHFDEAEFDSCPSSSAEDEPTRPTCLSHTSSPDVDTVAALTNTSGLDETCTESLPSHVRHESPVRVHREPCQRSAHPAPRTSLKRPIRSLSQGEPLTQTKTEQRTWADHTRGLQEHVPTRKVSPWICTVPLRGSLGGSWKRLSSPTSPTPQ